MCAGEAAWGAAELVGGVEGALSDEGVAENFFRAEEAFDFDTSVFDGVGCMDYVFLSAHAEIASNSSGCGFAPVGGAGHGAHYFYGVVSFKNHDDDRCGHHGVKDKREEGTVDEMCVMNTKNFFVEAHHLYARDEETFPLVALYNIADEAARNRRGLQNNKGLFHKAMLSGVTSVRMRAKIRVVNIKERGFGPNSFSKLVISRLF